MNLTQTNSKINFERINKFNVAIASLKNQLKNVANIDELTLITSKIIDLEQQIIVEKTAGYEKLEKEKKEIEEKIDRIKRDLRKAEDDLQRVGNNLELKINGYKKTLQTKIDLLNDEYSCLVKYTCSTN